MPVMDLVKKYGWKALLAVFAISGLAGMADFLGLADVSSYLNTLKPAKIEVSSTVVV